MLEQLSIVNDEASDFSDRDPDLTDFYLPGWNLLVKPVKAKDEVVTKTGTKFFLPDKVADDMNYLSNVCKVLRVGPLAYTQETFKGQVWCKEGDYVLIPRLTGTKIKYDGVPLTIVACDRVLAVVKDPRLLDQTVNAFGS